MSADNWDICPKCLAAAKKAADEASAKVYEQYGKVPPEEFDRLREEIPTVDPEKHRTFREDYEFYGADTGEVHASYSGRCSECNLSVDLKIDKRFWEPSS